MTHRHRTHLNVIAVIGLALLLTTIPMAARAADKPIPEITRAMIISIDGLRPDLMLRADAPRLRKLLDQSTFTMWARTTPASITLPSHVSMLTGVTPEAHGIMWNADLPLSKPVYPAAPTLLQLAKRAGLTTALAAGKSKFDVFDAPGALDWKFIPDTETTDADTVISSALQILRDHKPDVFVVHIAGVDNVGHARGWGSPEQMAEIASADRALGQLLDALTELKLADSTFVIVTADHGGVGRSHGPEDPRSRTIPWIAAGPGIRKGFDLTRMGADFNVDTYDTFMTTCTMLGITPQRRVIGKLVSPIIEKLELTLPTRAPKMSPATSPATEPTTRANDQ